MCRRSSSRVTALALAFALCACGRLGFDAQGADLDGDGGVPAGPASLTLRSPAGPVQDRSVVFHGPDGAVLAVEQTGPSGTATHDLPPGGMITVSGADLAFLDSDASVVLFTTMGVQPGDALALGAEFDRWDKVAFVDAVLPGAAAGAMFYDVDVGCDLAKTDDPTQVLTVGLYRDCFQRATTFDIIAYAHDADYDLVAHTSLKGVAITGESTIRVDLPPWRTGTVRTDMTLTAPPPAAEYVDVSLSAVAGDIAFLVDGDKGYPEGGEPVLLSMLLPDGLADGVEYDLSVQHDSPGDGPSHASFVRVRQSGVPGSVVHDLSSLLLPTISTSLIDTAVPSRPEVVFTTGGDLSIADGGLAVLSWQDEQGGTYEWWILFPPGLERVLVPELPDFLANLRPSATSSFSDPGIVVFDADYIAGYDEVRTDYGFDYFLHEGGGLPGEWMVRASAGPGSDFE